MKLKYKKMIILVSACAMGIGLVTLSVARPKTNDGNKKANTEQMLEKEDASENDTLDLADAVTQENAEAASSIQANDIKDADKTESVSADNNRIAQAESSTTEITADKLVKNEYKDVNQLINKYLEAKLSKDVKNFDGIVNDISAFTKEDLERQTSYIDDYSNVDVYTKKGPEEGSLIVYAYHEVKFTDIETLAPAMNMFYVKQNESGDHYIYVGNVDEDTAKYIEVVNQSDDVMEVVYEVNDKLKKAIDSDEQLAIFYAKLEETAKQVAQND